MWQTYVLLGTLLVTGAGCKKPGPPAPPANDEARAATARRFFSLLTEGKLAEGHTLFNPIMKAALPLPALEEAWRKTQAQAGPFQKLLGERALTVQGSRVFDFTCAFAKHPLDVRVSVDRDARVEGLFFRPASGKLPGAADGPPYARRSALVEEEVTVGGGELTLPGTLALPRQRHAGALPAVVLVHGSGPQDRDETIGPNRPFRDLAFGLAAKGIAVLRYEKRTRRHGQKLDPRKITLKEETIDDALAAVKLLRARAPLVDPARVFVLGHSLGGVALPRIARDDGKLGGLIFMAASARPLEELIVEQLSHIAGLDGTLSPEEKAQIEAARAAAATVKSPELSADTPASKLPFGIPAAYWLDLRANNPLTIAAALPGGTRMLFLQGARDYQVTVKDLELWRGALAEREKRGEARFVLYPKGNHLLADGEGRCEPAEYLRPAFVSAAAVDEIARFVLARGR
jgi:hypothetical protein